MKSKREKHVLEAPLPPTRSRQATIQCLQRRRFARNWQDEHSSYFAQNLASELLHWNAIGRLSAQDLVELLRETNTLSEDLPR